MSDPASRPKRYLWARHASPGSVWSLFATFPVLVVFISRRDRRLLSAALGLVAVNPLLFGPPEDDDA